MDENNFNYFEGEESEMNNSNQEEFSNSFSENENNIAGGFDDATYDTLNIEEEPLFEVKPVESEEPKAEDSFNAYREVIKPKKTFGKKQFVAAMLGITVLNLAVFAGAFMLGKNYGTAQKYSVSKNELVETLHNEDTKGATTTATDKDEKPTVDIAKAVGPAVVGITSTINGQINFFGQSTSSNVEGSGIIISNDGYIVTNNHVISNASVVKVLLNTGSEYDAKIIGADAQTDLAVIKIEPNEELTVATFGDSNSIEVGERAIAIGNPMGIEFFGSVTEGIISAVNRTVVVENRMMNVIQTDAAINSGNSGGALINRFGEVIGINSIKVESSGVEGMGFAIPSSEAKPIIADLIECGYVKGRPVIGISTRDVTAYMAKAYSWPQGVQVMEVTSQAARESGLEQGDIIVEAEGQKITTLNDLNKIKKEHNPGDSLNMKVYKYSTGRNESVSVRLSEQIPG